MIRLAFDGVHDWYIKVRADNVVKSKMDALYKDLDTISEQIDK